MKTQPMQIIDGIKVYGVADILDERPNQDRQWSWDEESAYVMGWCAAADAAYYARPKEDFFIADAVLMAKTTGKDCVVVEDMS